MRIVVTGANGFIGQALCPYLAHNLSAKIITMTRRPVLQSPDNLCFTQSDSELIGQLKGEVGCMVHLASRAHTNQSTYADFERDNIQLSERIARLCIAANIPRLIYLSSIKANGNSTSGREPYDANEIPQPEDDYGKSKLASEVLLQKLTRDSATELVIIRPPLVYGNNNKGNLLSLVKLIKKGIPLPFANISNKRDLISIENLCSLICACITHPAAKNNVFLASDGISRSTKEIIELLCKRENLMCKQVALPLLFFKWLKIFPPLQPKVVSLTDDLQLNITKTQSILGWQPKP